MKAIAWVANIIPALAGRGLIRGQGQGLRQAECVTVEMHTNELKNEKEMIYKPFWETDVYEKRAHDIWDDSDRDDTKQKALSL